MGRRCGSGNHTATDEVRGRRRSIPIVCPMFVSYALFMEPRNPARDLTFAFEVRLRDAGHHHGRRAVRSRLRVALRAELWTETPIVVFGIPEGGLTGRTLP